MSQEILRAVLRGGDSMTDRLNRTRDPDKTKPGVVTLLDESIVIMERIKIYSDKNLNDRPDAQYQIESAIDVLIELIRSAAGGLT